MCGIVGYFGRKEAIGIILDALKRLEYRGYDSAGVAIWDSGKIKVIKKKGKVKDLQALVSGTRIRGTIGIGHTRWATHGIPSDENAHPHVSGDFAIVHNGIIENYLDIKERLLKKGYTFSSETDTEVIPNLIVEYTRMGLGTVDAVRMAISELRGSYALALVRKRERILIGVRNESPLVLGIGEGEYFLTSDVPAIIPHTNRVIFLEDGDIVVIDGQGFRIIDREGHPVDRKLRELSYSPLAAEKGEYKHFMLKEIYEQPRAIMETMIGRLKEEEGEVVFEEWSFPEFEKIERFLMVACGTSYHACMIGKYIFERNLRIPVEVDIASEFRYRDPPIRKGDILILVSQSGETADTIAAMREGKRRGAYTLSVCNVLGSSLSRESDGTIYTRAGPEIGVASTKTFTSQITVLFMMMLYFASKLRSMEKERIRTMISELKKVPHLVKVTLDGAEKIEELAGKYMGYRNFLYLGRGINYPTVLEGALKLKEISYIHAEGYAAGEMKHGPIALIDGSMPVLVLSPHDETYEKTCSNIEEVISRKGKVLLLTDFENHVLGKRVEDSIYFPPTIYELQPIVSVVPLQLFAYHMANLLGLDVDQPRNLAKSVTVE